MRTLCNSAIQAKFCVAGTRSPRSCHFCCVKKPTEEKRSHSKPFCPTPQIFIQVPATLPSSAQHQLSRYLVGRLKSVCRGTSQISPWVYHTTCTRAFLRSVVPSPLLSGLVTASAFSCPFLRNGILHDRSSRCSPVDQIWTLFGRGVEAATSRSCRTHAMPGSSTDCDQSNVPGTLEGSR